MEKLRYPKNLYDSFMERTEESKVKIMDAELKSFKEIEVSQHFPKVWIITSYAVSLCTLKADTSLQKSLSNAVDELKYSELRDMDPEMKASVGDKPSEVLGILGIFPSKAMNIKKVIEINKPLAAKLMAKRITVEDIENEEQYKEYRQYLCNTIFTQFDCFYKDTEVNIYKAIIHNNEILDIYLEAELNGGNGRINGIDKLIDVDRQWVE